MKSINSKAVLITGAAGGIAHFHRLWLASGWR